MAASEVAPTKPRILLIYYTYTQQSLRVVEASNQLADGLTGEDRAQTAPPPKAQAEMGG